MTRPVRLVRVVPEEDRQPVGPSLLAAWITTTLVGAVLLLSSSSWTSGRILSGQDRSAVVGVLAVGLGGVLASWVLAGLFARLRVRAGPRAALLGATGLAALGLSAVAVSYLADSPWFAMAVGRSDVGLAPVSLLVGIVVGIFVAGLSTAVLMALSAIRVSASPRSVRALALGTCLLGLLFAVVATYFPEGVNAAFAGRAWAPILVAGFLAVLVVEAVNWQSPNDSHDAVDTETPSQGLVLALLPMIPVVRYLVVNRTEVSASAMVLVLVGFAAAAAVLVLMVPALFTPVANPAVVRVVLSGWSFALLNMATVADSQEWFGEGAAGLQALTFAGVIAFLFLLGRAPGQVLTWGILVFLGLEFANAFMVPTEDAPSVATGETVATSAPAPAALDEWLQRPNVYLLIYESYANQETMAAYGFDNSEQVAFLEELGFEVYHGTYSVAGNSMATMSRVLAASSKLDRERHLITSGDSYVTETFSGEGYQTFGVFHSDYFYGTSEPSYDVFVPGRISPWRPILTSILRGEFRASESFNKIEYGDYLDAKRGLLAAPPAEQPRFMYTHNRYPGHSQNSGKCGPDEGERYFRNVEIANEEMRSDLATFDPEAIIIIAGDHGPYLTKNCTQLDGDYQAEEVERLDVQDRYGTFLAIRWPASFNAERRPTVVQDVFPLVFAELSGDPSYWDDRQVDPVTRPPRLTSGVIVDDGIIRGGVHDGEPLFLYRAG